MPKLIDRVLSVARTLCARRGPTKKAPFRLEGPFCPPVFSLRGAPKGGRSSPGAPRAVALGHARGRAAAVWTRKLFADLDPKVPESALSADVDDPF